MKKKTVFSVVLTVWCVLCLLSVFQVWNVLANHRQNERDEHLIGVIPRGNLDKIDTTLQNRPIGIPDWFKPGEVVQKIEFPYYSDEFSKQKTDDSDDEYSHNLAPQGIEGPLPPAFKDFSSLYGSMYSDLFIRGPWISYAYIKADICELHLKKMILETVEVIHSNVPNHLGIEYDESMGNSFRNSNEPIYSEFIVKNNFKKYICEECNKIRDEYMVFITRGGKK